MTASGGEVHKPYTDDGLTYCGWYAGPGTPVVDGCGQVWPCSTVQARRKGTAWDLLGADPSAEVQSGRASEIAAAEARGVERGYRRAVDRLRDGEAWARWARANDDALYDHDTEMAAAYLEAVEGDEG